MRTSGREMPGSSCTVWICIRAWQSHLCVIPGQAGQVEVTVFFGKKICAYGHLISVMWTAPRENDVGDY